MTRALSEVCTNKHDGEIRSWKAFVDYTFEPNYSDKYAKLTITNAGAGGTEPDTGSGEEIRNRTITLSVSGQGNLTKQFNGSSYYYNAYPNKTFSEKNHMTWVGSGGTNNTNWGVKTYLLDKKASAYNVTVSFTMNVTSGAWSGLRTATATLSVPAGITHTIPAGVRYWSTADEAYITAGNTFVGTPQEGDRYEILSGGNTIFTYCFKRKYDISFGWRAITTDSWGCYRSSAFAETSFTVLGSIFGFPVTHMPYAFADSTVQTTNIPSSVTDIEYCFDGSALEGYITIPDSVDSYYRAFANTTNDIFVEGNTLKMEQRYANVHLPKWEVTHTVNSQYMPDHFTTGKAKVHVYVSKNNSTYTEIDMPEGWDVVEDPDNNKWSITFTVDKTQVIDNTDPDSSVYVKVVYSNILSDEPDSQTAFFSTARNANYHTGLANNMFVSGIKSNEPAVQAYSSRVWYSYANNPLYYPDTNYIEVGSNDKSIMGLIKVGSYLGIIKQGSTVDTSIYLAYPTSFEDDTTFAVKQSINGVGAVAKYAFNVLNDETLFLSEEGVMAIDPSEDEHGTVKDRSFYINGKLTKEPNLESAYSFVWNGFYLLGVNDHVYVLDGAQRNSWGNDKTNLVYECYYLEGITAKNFVKCGDELFFTDGLSMMRFKTDKDNNPYMDDGVPVTARWATILDDDGSLNYLKSMQKKGNLVSILPSIVKYKYVEIYVDEDTFNANKTNYWYVSGGVFAQCTEASVYDADMQYYVRQADVSDTKVYVRKDNNEPVEIQRTFNESSAIPSEMIMKKKIKKYKRLQFIIANESAEPFGVDSIIKCYTVGNYAKK